METHVRTAHVQSDPTHRPELDLTPNSKTVNALLMTAQIPHDWLLQNLALFVPRSQIHWVL